jgi:broad specificity phosphatase PhoE
MILYCVRHGETEANASGRIQGQTDSPLSEMGRRQCQAVAAALKGLPIEAIYSSPLQRALDSAKCIADALEVKIHIDERLMEINAGVFQGLSWDEINERYAAEAVRWRSHDPDFRIPQGESRRDLMRRAGEAFAAVREAGHAQALIVAHGGSLAAALKVLLGVPAERNPFNFYNSSISRLGWDTEVKLQTFNQLDHLHGLVGGSGDL